MYNKKFACVITLYNTDEKRIEQIIYSLKKQFNYIVFIDNTPNRNLKLNYDKVIYIPNNRNLGLSKALNIGCNKALKLGCDFITLIDQDTDLPNNYLINMYKAYEKYKNKFQIGCIGPVYFDMYANKKIIPHRKIRIERNIYDVESIITSGMFFHKDIFLKFKFNENLFLDYVDWDYCWRLKWYNYKIMLTKNIVINHYLGEGIKRIIFFRIRIGNPVRVYYQVRDSLYLLKNKYVPIIPKTRFLLNLVFKPIVYFIFLDKKMIRIKFFFKSFIDYLKGEKGGIVD